MSSAVPIHPMLRLARRTLLSPAAGAAKGGPSRLSANARLISSTRSTSARPSKRAAAVASSGGGGSSGSSKSSSGVSAAAAPSTSAKAATGAAASPSPSTSSSPSAHKYYGDRATLDSIAANSKKDPSSAQSTPSSSSSSSSPSSVKLTDKRSPQVQKEAQQLEEQNKAQVGQGQQVEGKEQTAPVKGDTINATQGTKAAAAAPTISSSSSSSSSSNEQNVRKGASMHPAAVEKERKVTATAGKESDQPRVVDSLVEGIASTKITDEQAGKLTEGIVIHRNDANNSKNGGSRSDSASNAETSSSASSPFGKSSGTSNEQTPPPRSSTDRVNEDGGSGPPATTQVTELGSIRPPNPLYPFDTHAFIKRLQKANFVAKRMDSALQGEKGAESSSTSPSAETSLSSIKRHDPAEAIMEATRHLIVSRGKRVIDHHISKTEVDNQAYLFTAALSELRTELQVRARNDAAALRSMVTLLQREVDGLNQKMREDVAGMKHDIQVDMNNRKGEAKEEQNTLEQEIQDLNNRFTISISDLKTEIEQNIKWDATRRALTVVFGCVVILIATLTAADHLTREDVDEDAVAHNKRANQAHKTVNEPVVPRTKSAEEIGLIPNYDEGDGSRYV